MRQIPKRKCTAADLAVIIILLVCTVFLFLRPLLFPAGQGGSFRITTPDGTETHSLGNDAVYAVVSGTVHLTVTVAGGAVSVTEADCPDGICKKTGTIKNAGEAIVCAPGRIVIEIEGGADAGEDFIVG